MSGSQLSPAYVRPASTVALPGLGQDARAAALSLTLGLNRQSVEIRLSDLPPGQKFGKLSGGTIYIDNTQNSVAAEVLFPDTGARFDVPASSAPWLLAVTGENRFIVTSAVTQNTDIFVQCINTAVAPSGVQPILGSVTVEVGTITAGSVDVTNFPAIQEVSGTVDIGAGVEVIGTVDIGSVAGNVTVDGTVEIGNVPTVASKPLGYKAQSALLSETIVPNTGTTIAAAGVALDHLTVFNLDNAETLWLDPSGGVPAVNSGVPVFPGGASFRLSPAPTTPVTAISSGTAIAISAEGG